MDEKLLIDLEWSECAMLHDTSLKSTGASLLSIWKACRVCVWGGGGGGAKQQCTLTFKNGPKFLTCIAVFLMVLK